MIRFCIDYTIYTCSNPITSVCNILVKYTRYLALSPRSFLVYIIRRLALCLDENSIDTHQK